MGKHRCVCETDFCRADGGDATIRFPRDEARFKHWCQSIFGDGQDELPKHKNDPRLSAAHFAPGSLVADAACCDPGGERVGVKVAEDALPDQTSAGMAAASRGALARSLRLEAINKRHCTALLDGAVERQKLKERIKTLELKVSELTVEVADLKGKEEEEESVKGIDHTILIGKDPTAVRSLTGLTSHESLQVRGFKRRGQIYRSSSTAVSYKCVLFDAPAVSNLPNGLVFNIGISKGRVDFRCCTAVAVVYIAAVQRQHST